MIADYALTLIYGDAELAPRWAAMVAEWTQNIGELLLLGVSVWLVSSVLKRIVKSVGRLRLKDDERFEGSAWDLGGSLIQFFVLIIGAPLLLGAIGIDATGFLEANAPGIASGLVVLFAGIMIARWVSVSVRSFGHRIHRRQKTDDTLFVFLASMLRYGIIALTLIFALTYVGFAPASLIAIVGAAGLAIALALQDTLRAVAAGFLLAIFRPFRIGDWVTIAGAEGEVAEITPFHTTIKTVDNRAVIIPNDKAWSDPITNFAAFPERRLDFYIDISREDDIERALNVLEGAIAALPKCRRKQEVWTGVHEITPYAVRLRARPWLARADFLDFRSECYIAVKRAFEAEGITIPYPQQVEFSGRMPPSQRGMAGDAHAFRDAALAGETDNKA